jgi:hypothetical protein
MGEWPCDEHPDKKTYIFYIHELIEKWSLSGKRFHITSLDDHYILIPGDTFWSEEVVKILPVANPHGFNLTRVTNENNALAVYPEPDFKDQETIRITYDHICKVLLNHSWKETESNGINVWIGPDVFFLAYFEENQLKSVRSQRYKTPNDIVYFILSLKKQFRKENEIPVQVDGFVHPQSELMKTLSVYFSPVVCLAQ